MQKMPTMHLWRKEPNQLGKPKKPPGHKVKEVLDRGFVSGCCVELLCYHAHKSSISRNQGGEWTLCYLSHLTMANCPPRDREMPNNGQLYVVNCAVYPHYRPQRNSLPYSMTFLQGRITSCLTLLLTIQAGDVELNLGPQLPKFPCKICRKAAKWTQKNCLQCKLCQGWYHAKCLGMPELRD